MCYFLFLFLFLSLFFFACPSVFASLLSRFCYFHLYLSSLSHSPSIPFFFFNLCFVFPEWAARSYVRKNGYTKATRRLRWHSTQPHLPKTCIATSSRAQFLKSIGCTRNHENNHENRMHVGFRASYNCQDCATSLLFRSGWHVRRASRRLFTNARRKLPPSKRKWKEHRGQGQETSDRKKRPPSHSAQELGHYRTQTICMDLNSRC